MLVDFDLTSSLGDTRRHRCYQRGCCPPEQPTSSRPTMMSRPVTGSRMESWGQDMLLAAYAVLPASAFSAAQQPFCCIENSKIRVITVV